MIKLFLPVIITVSIICSIFFIIWVIRTPSELWESLMFRYRDGWVEILVSMVTWVFLSAFVILIMIIANLIR